MRSRLLIAGIMLLLSACGRPDTSAIEAEPIDFNGTAGAFAQEDRLDAIDQEKALALGRYHARAGNCRQDTAAGLARMKDKVQPGDHNEGETPSGKPLIDHAHCIDKPGVIPIDDPVYGQPMASTVGDAIRQQQKIEQAFKDKADDQAFGLGLGHEERRVSCLANPSKVVCTPI